MWDMKTWWLLFSVALSCDAYNILVVFPVPAQSHANLGHGVVRNLLNAGHEVTYITPIIYPDPPANLRQIDISSNVQLPSDMLNIKAIMTNKIKIEDHSLLLRMMVGIFKSSVEHKDVQKLLNDPKEQFDVVIAELMFSDLPSGYAAIFDCPLIWVSAVEVHWMILNMIDFAPNPAYSVDSLSPYTPPLDFGQRANELWIRLKVQILQYLYTDEIQRKAYEQIIAPIVLKRGRQPPSFDDIRYNASLVFGNSYVSMGQASNLPHNYKPIGGFHIEDTVPSLPKDLKKLMNNAVNGVIYFSMGSNLKSKDLPDEIKWKILKMFGSLKQTVLWKFEEVLPNLPANVHILKWAPQTSILSHPNCVLFITHGGLLSTTEAIHFGVPIIGIPVFADQFTNVIRAVDKGFAKRVDLSYTMAETLKLAIEEVISNPRYTEKAKELSFIYHDRPVKPGVELVHWVQHVVRTRGAPHLRSPALQVPLYQRLYLDLAAVITAILIGSWIGVRRIWAVLCPKKIQKNKKKNN